MEALQIWSSTGTLSHLLRGTGLEPEDTGGSITFVGLKQRLHDPEFIVRDTPLEQVRRLGRR